MDLHCNVQACRKPLTGTLWVTSCSHSFCEEHASTLTLKNIKCPACNTALGKRFDVIRQNSNPAEDYRAMLLVGLRPEIVLDMAMRAVSFWNYQVEHELKFQLTSAKRSREIAEKSKTTNMSLMKQIASTKKTSDCNERLVGDLKSTIRQLKEQITYKDRQLKKVQHLFDSFKSKTSFLPQEVENTSDNDSFDPKHNEFHEKNAPKKTDFVFEPRFAPQ
ncbi:E3 ubiquitin-protein ligase CCNB1IP1-like [Thrips palmi]|uniref:E3 ubiquitin-protein ligase CCNB1IP1-like n=1 Tax=Thrips palmi TaxID=161013 RepID=A0A6P9AIZ0_THRPL|nr:E3 ubiquitin-protein ligase CCNB1IP1-like [Thrips palmi]